MTNMIDAILLNTICQMMKIDPRWFRFSEFSFVCVYTRLNVEIAKQARASNMKITLFHVQIRHAPLTLPYTYLGTSKDGMEKKLAQPYIE